MGIGTSIRASIRPLERYDARLALGGLPAASALMLAWPISAALLVAIRFALFGSFSLWAAPPWVTLPLFWPALILLPVAARIPTKLLPLCFTLAGLISTTNLWLPVVTTGAIPQGWTATQIINAGAMAALPPAIYGCILAWLAKGRDRSGPADMRGLRPYLAALLSLVILAVLVFGLPILLLSGQGRSGDMGGLATAGAIIMGGMFLNFPWVAAIAGVATISITHGATRPYLAFAFLAVALALCPLHPSLPSFNLAVAAAEAIRTPPYPVFTTDLWRRFGFVALGVVAYGLSLWATRRRVDASRPATKLPLGVATAS